MKIKSWVESWQPRAKLRGSARARWLPVSITSRDSGSQTSNTCEKHIDTCNVVAEDWLVKLPDSASSEPYASTIESDSDDFDHEALMDRNDRDQLFQTQSWPQVPNQPWQNRWWEHSKTLRDQTDYHAPWWQPVALSLFTATHFQSLPLCFRLLSRWRREAVRLLTTPRNTQARRQGQSQ